MNCYLFVKNLRIGAVYFHRNHAACARKKTRVGRVARMGKVSLSYSEFGIKVRSEETGVRS
jgi:hypothetical protein